MNDLNDITSETSDSLEDDMSETSDWAGFDFDETNRVSTDTEELSDATDASSFSTGLELDESDIQLEAEKVADYVRSFGFDKAADYIERHYDGYEFIPRSPIPITTRNMALDGLESENGVPFERRTAELANGLTVEDVFPKFESTRIRLYLR